MTDKKHILLSSTDGAIRLDLIAKVHGTEQAEDYFNNINTKSKVFEVYCALLNCYAQAKQLKKAEATMQKMRDLMFSKRPMVYNLMLNMYYRTGHKVKFNSLMNEMEEIGIARDSFTYGIRLTAAAAASGLEGIDKIAAEWESDPYVHMSWVDYSIAANCYTKAGAADKALVMLKKSEEQIPSSERKRGAYEYLMTQYAARGKKYDSLRLWRCYKEKMMVYNRGYICIMTSVLKFDDIESAEKIFKEWESEFLFYVSYDDRIPNSLIGAYTRNEFLDKAEALMTKIKKWGQKPSPIALNYLAKGYLDCGRIEKALNSVTKAVLGAQPGWRPDKDVVIACLKYFETKADKNGAEKFIKRLGNNNIIPANVQESFLSHIQNGNLTVVVGEMELDFLKGNVVTNELPVVEEDVQH